MSDSEAQPLKGSQSDSSDDEQEKRPGAPTKGRSSRTWIIGGVLLGVLFVAGVVVAVFILRNGSSQTQSLLLGNPSVAQPESSILVVGPTQTLLPPFLATSLSVDGGLATSSSAQDAGPTSPQAATETLSNVKSSEATVRSKPATMGRASLDASSSLSSKAPSSTQKYPLTGTPRIARKAGKYDNSAMSAKLNKTTAPLKAGQYYLQNIATQQYVIFDSLALVEKGQSARNIHLGAREGASVIGLEYVDTASKTWGSTWSSSWASTLSNLAIFQDVKDSMRCAVAQWQSDIGGYNRAMASYPCYEKAVSPLLKFPWYIIPASEGQSLPLARRASANFFLLAYEHLIDMRTTAATGANITAWNNALGLALTDFDPSDPWQLFSFEPA